MTYKQAPTMPASHPIFGLFREFQSDPLGLLDESRSYGDVVRLRFANKHNYVMHHPEAVQDVLVRKAKHFTKDAFIRNAFEPFIGNGLTISEGEDWKKQRKLMAPAFHSQRIRAYADIILEQTHKLLDQWRIHPERDIQKDMVYLTTGIVGMSLFGEDASSMTDDINRLLREINHLFLQRAQSINLPRWVPNQHNRDLNRVVSALDEIVMHFIEERRGSDEDYGDFLSMLLLSEDAEGNRLSEREVRDQAVTIFLAGNDTTAAQLAWAFYAITQHPHVIQPILDELDTVAPNRDLTFDDLPQLDYLSAFVNEVQRLYPITWAFSRECVEDCEIMGYHIPAKSIITVAPWVMHRDATWWDNPQDFQPERFLGEQERPKYSFYPFGGGARVCIGSSMALMEIKMVLATMLRQMELDYLNTEPTHPLPLLVMQPHQPINLRVSERTEQSELSTIV